jgi:hypothetical protein
VYIADEGRFPLITVFVFCIIIVPEFPTIPVFSGILFFGGFLEKSPIQESSIMDGIWIRLI